MIRILHVLGGLERGGAESMVMNLYRAVDRTQVQFDFIIHTEKHQAYYDEIISLGGKIYSFPSFTGTNVLTLRKIWKDFFIEHPEYKILHSHVRSYASLYLPIAHKAGLKTIIHSHSTSNGKGLASIVKYIMQYPLRFQADHFFACSKEAGAWLFGEKVVNSGKFHILQNAIDAEKYRFNREIRVKYRKEIGLGDKKTFIHVGRFHPAKNHSFLLNLFAEIHKKNNNTVLLLAGDGELRSSIEQQIATLGIQESVILLGSRNDVPNLLQASDCFLFPSIWEGFGMVAVEAQAAGVPCICSTGIPKSVAVVPNLCHFVSTDSMQKWIDFAISAKPLLADTSEHMRKNGFDIKTTAGKLSEFYLKEWTRIHA